MSGTLVMLLVMLLAVRRRQRTTRNLGAQRGRRDTGVARLGFDIKSVQSRATHARAGASWARPRSQALALDHAPDRPGMIGLAEKASIERRL